MLPALSTAMPKLWKFGPLTGNENDEVAGSNWMNVRPAPYEAR